MLKYIHRSILPVIILSFLYVSILYGKEYHSNPELLEWIPHSCCVTNDCCWKIQESELILLPNRKAVVKSTGQEKAYQFSVDNNFYRCACDYDNGEKTWVRHQGANTRCIFVPNRGM